MDQNKKTLKKFFLNFKKENIADFLNKSKIFLKDHLFLLLKSSADNHLRIQRIKVKPEEGETCNLAFDSYSDLKKYQRKVRLFTYSLSSTLASILIAVLIVQIFFPSQRSFGATKTFTQDRWLSQTSNTAAPDGNGTPPAAWTEYNTKDANLALVNGGTTGTYAQLSQITDARTDTTRGDFTGGSVDSNTAVSGTAAGDDASVALNASANEIVNGSSFSCALKGGKVYCWGLNDVGQLGNGTSQYAVNATPTAVKINSSTELTGATSISAGSNFACAVVSNGNVYCWGSNSYSVTGILGVNDGTTAAFPYATLLSTISNITKIDAGATDTCAIGSGGSVYCWGRNTPIGITGTGDTTQRLVPVQVKDTAGTGFLTGITKIDVGSDHVCALNGTTQTAYCWGNNNYGQLANGNTSTNLLPVQVNASNVTDIAVNGSYVTNSNAGSTCYVSSGTVYCTGAYTFTSVVVVSAIPAEPGGSGNLTGISQLTGCEGNGVTNFCALKNGSVYCWGGNTGGNFGVGNTTSSATPVKMLAPGGSAGIGPYLTTVSKIAKDRDSNKNYAINSIGTINSSGYNGSTVLDQTVADSTSVLVPGYVRSSGTTYFNANSYPVSGIYTSKTFDFGVKVGSVKLEFSQTTPSTSTVGINVQASNNGSTWTTVKTGAVNNEDIAAGVGYRYFRYVATLTSNSDQTQGPSLDMAKFTATYYPASQTLTSSIYNTGQPANIINSATVNGLLGTNTGVAMQIRTSPDGVNWSDWCGSTACDNSNTFAFTGLTSGSYTEPPAISANTSPLYSIGNKQYFQYKLILTSDGQATPSVDQVKVQYVINNPPIVSLSSQPSQTADTGVVSIPYSITGDAAEPTDRYNANVFFSTSNDGGITLKTAANSSQTTIALTGTDTSYLPASGYVMIDNEVMAYSGVTPGSGNDVTLTGVTRGTWQGGEKTTLASAHASTGVPVYVLANNANITTVSPNGEIGIGDLKKSGGADLLGDTSEYSYIINWNPKEDTNFNKNGAGRYNSQVKIKVVINDGNAASQINTTAGGTSAAFAVDAKNPIINTLTLNRTQTAGKLTASLNTTEDSSSGFTYAYYYPAINGDGSPMGCSDFPASPTWSAATTGASTHEIDDDSNKAFREICVKAKDNYGNTSTVATALTPNTPLSPQYYDISDPNTSAYRLFVSWAKPSQEGTGSFAQYDIFRCISASGTCTPSAQYATAVTNKSQNYITDSCDGDACETTVGNGLDSTKKYCYIVRAKDANGDYSAWSSNMCVIPGSGASSVDKNVAVDGLTVVPAKLYSTEATIAWSTVNAADSSELLLADATVYWKKSTDSEWNSVSDTSYTSTHSVTVKNLQPNTAYDYKVISQTAWGTSTGETSPASFTTKSGPYIKNITEEDIGNTIATIIWDTTDGSNNKVNSTTSVTYSTNSDLSSSQTQTCAGGVSHHSCTLTGLSSGVQYYYSLTSDLTTDTNGGNYYTFTTPTDTIAPIVTLSVNNPIILTDTKVSLALSTNERAKSWIVYGTVSQPSFVSNNPTGFDPTQTSNSYENQPANASGNYSYADVVNLSNLTPNTTYYYRIISQDISGNFSISDQQTLTTRRALTESHPDLVALSQDPEVVLTSDSEAVVVAETNTDATSEICWSTSGEISALDFGTGAQTCANSDTIASATKVHVYHLTGLTPETLYNVKVKTVDSANGSISYASNNVTFTTGAEQVLAEPDLIDFSAPPTVLMNSDQEAVVVVPQLNTTATGKLCWSASQNITNVDSCDEAHTLTISSGSKNHVYHITGLVASTPYYVKVKATGVKNSAISFTSAYASFTTGQALTQAHPDLDTENTGQPEVVEVFDTKAIVKMPELNTDATSKLCWSTNSSINVDACESGHDVTISSASRSHVYLLTGLPSNSTVYYKVKVVDSQNSNLVFNSQTGSFATAVVTVSHPDLTLSDGFSLTTTAYADTSAVITLPSLNTTATSKLCYSTASLDSVNFDTCVDGKSVTNESKVHVYYVGGLTPETTYNFKAKVSDTQSANTATSNVLTVLTKETQVGHAALTAPSDPSAANVIVKTPNQAVVRLITNTDTTAEACFSRDPIAKTSECTGSGKYAITDSSVGTSHVFLIGEGTAENPALLSDTAYYFRFKAIDSQDSNITFKTEDASFTTQVDPEQQHDPLSTISTPGNDDITESQTYAFVSWETDQLANSRIECSGDKDSEDLVHYTKYHTLKIINLSPDTEYSCKVKSTDNLSTPTTKQSDSFTLHTSKEASLDHAPLSEITDVSDPPKVLTDTAAVVTFNTDQSALCYIQATTSQGSYTSPTVFEEDGFLSKTNYTISHAIKFTGLLFNTTYYYKINCVDNIDSPEVTSSEYSFTTKEKQYGQTEVDASIDKIGPIISNIKVASTTGESATITWDTDEKGNSLVKFGPDSNYGNMAGDDKVNSDQNNYDTAHSVTINGLIPAAKYYYTVVSTDLSGNISESSQNEFSTAAPSSLSSIKVESTSLGQAIITWHTDKETTSTVEYGTSTTYGQKKEDTSFTKDHSIGLSNLEMGVAYHFRVKGKDRTNIWYASSDNTFQPKSPPEIKDIVINEITEHSAKITFKTSVPTDVNAIYTNVSNSSDAGSQGSPELTVDHEIDLKNLQSGTTYNLKIKVRDEQGTESQAQAKDFTTGVDNVAPKIDQIHTDAALTQSDKVQSIISWKTDEQSTTQLIYKEGRNGESKTVNISDALVTNHIAVMTVFKPGTVYYFKVKSVDASNNEAVSSDFALLTPKRKENIIQIIVNNFQDIFGWAR